MPLLSSTLIIVIAAIGCWLLSVIFIRVLFRPYSPKKIAGFRLHGIVPAMLPVVADKVSAMATQEFLSAEKIAAKLDDPALMQQLKPTIETHIDEFLKVKLKEAFPLLHNFMGEKTLAKFKAAFLTEVESILPGVLKTYSASLINQWQPENVIKEKINSIDVKETEAMIAQYAGRQIRQFQLAALLFGALLGTIQLIVLRSL